MASKNAPSSAPAPVAEANAAEETILRFDIHQRLQHGLMALSFTMLVLTGWPLAAHGVGASQSLLDLFGGMATAGLLHRIFGVGLIIASVYHLGYLGLKLKQRKLRPTMLPGPQDARDLVANLKYFLGLSKERPRFGQYTYFEKFDYWAVFWGVVVMAGSGLIRWFPEQTVLVLPTWVYEIAFFAHADEGLLALLAIFVWHFYNVHLRPGVFPMSPVFITGRLTMDELKHEHRGQYDALMAARAAKAAKADEGDEDDEEAQG